MDHQRRISATRDKLAAAEVDALFVTNLTNVRYLTGFSGTNGQVLITGSDATFLSDPRYAARAEALVTGAEIAIYPQRVTDLLPDLLGRAGLQRLGVEAKTMTLAERDSLADKLPETDLVATKDVVEDLRRTKDADEVALIRDAVRIADAAFEWLLDTVAPGMTEREIALRLEVRLRDGGGEAVSFDPIVGSGELSAHIHHTPTDRTLEKGDLVLFDFGCKVDGYCSDLTRTVVLGPATDEQKQMYELVLRANEAGITAAAAAKAARDVDAAARTLIDEAGHRDDFGHGLGHGVGLDIHEAPTLNRVSEDALRPGDVVTIEPGVYVKRTGGIRIEDCVLVTEGGCDVLSAAPKDELIEL